uniref:Uncharacterized protein n=1 Tax=Leersia perrieri TaxID=77586 RepID=A0A0D9X1C4_9ORYZ
MHVYRVRFELEPSLEIEFSVRVKSERERRNERKLPLRLARGACSPVLSWPHHSHFPQNSLSGSTTPERTADFAGIAALHSGEHSPRRVRERVEIQAADCLFSSSPLPLSPSASGRRQRDLLRQVPARGSGGDRICSVRCRRGGAAAAGSASSGRRRRASSSLPFLSLADGAGQRRRPVSVGAGPPLDLASSSRRREERRGGPALDGGKVHAEADAWPAAQWETGRSVPLAWGEVVKAATACGGRRWRGGGPAAWRRRGGGWRRMATASVSARRRRGSLPTTQWRGIERNRKGIKLKHGTHIN